MLPRKDIKKIKNASERTIFNKDKNALTQFFAIARNPEALTKDMIKQLGLIYQQQPKDFLGITVHHNFSVANNFINCNESDSYKCWMFLANEYSKIKHESGGMSRTLLYLFGWAFNNDLEPFIFSVIALKNNIHATRIQENAEGMKNVVNSHYAPKFYRQLEDLRQAEQNINEQEAPIQEVVYDQSENVIQTVESYLQNQNQNENENNNNYGMRL